MHQKQHEMISNILILKRKIALKQNKQNKYIKIYKISTFMVKNHTNRQWNADSNRPSIQHFER